MPNRWCEVPLGEVAEVIMGQSPPGRTYNEMEDGLPFLQGSADFGAASPKPIKWCSEPRRVARPGDLLISVRAPVGDTNLADRELAIGRGLAVIRPSDRATTSFLALALESRMHYLKAASGSGVFESITKHALTGALVPIPEVKEQHRIADFASAFDSTATGYADLVGAARRARLALAASIWRNSSSRSPLGELGEIVTGQTPSTKRREYWEPVALPFFTPGDLDGRLSLTTAARGVSDVGAGEARKLAADSVVQVCIGATIGKAARLAVPAVTNQQLNALVGLDKHDALLLANLLDSNSGRTTVLSYAGQTTLPILKKSAWAKIEVPWPNRPAREQTAELLAGFDMCEVAAEAALHELRQCRKASLGALMAGRMELPPSYDQLLNQVRPLRDWLY
jgi:type I restriction enzyme S subunit